MNDNACNFKVGKVRLCIWIIQVWVTIGAAVVAHWQFCSEKVPKINQDQFLISFKITVRTGLEKSFSFKVVNKGCNDYLFI